jgi:hypothetical protein
MKRRQNRWSSWRRGGIECAGIERGGKFARCPWPPMRIGPEWSCARGHPFSCAWSGVFQRFRGQENQQPTIHPGRLGVVRLIQRIVPDSWIPKGAQFPPCVPVSFRHTSSGVPYRTGLGGDASSTALSIVAACDVRITVSYLLLRCAPPHFFLACLCLLVHAQFPRRSEYTGHYIPARRRQANVRVSHLSPAARNPQ